MNLRDARDVHFARSAFSEDDYTARWVRTRVGPVPVCFPNSRARVRALRLHDLHHIATGYDTSLRGEAEQSAWELAAGCHHHVFAWAINLLAVFTLGFLAPRRTWRAFQRGRKSETLYTGEFSPDLLQQTVHQLRRHLKL